jgi:hypothetical protein
MKSWREETRMGRNVEEEEEREENDAWFWQVPPTRLAAVTVQNYFWKSLKMKSNLLLHDSFLRIQECSRIDYKISKK